MATPEMAPMPQNLPPQPSGIMGTEKSERSPKYRIPLADGTILIAYDDKDLMDKMGEYRANAN